MLKKAIKPKTCRICKAEFIPDRPLQRVCGFKCAIAVYHEKQEKDRKKDIRERKVKLKSKSDWLREAQSDFNKFIRVRDSELHCISCGRPHVGQYHAGHYRSVGAAPELRFNEDNVHKQCSPCNNFKSGNAIEYRINLVKKIGMAKVMQLETKHEPNHYTIDDIKEIKAIYRAKWKSLEAIL